MLPAIAGTPCRTAFSHGPTSSVSNLRPHGGSTGSLHVAPSSRLNITKARPGAAILPHDASEFVAFRRAEHGGLTGIFSAERRAIAGHDGIRPGEPTVAGDRLEHLKIRILSPLPPVEHAERRAASR